MPGSPPASPNFGAPRYADDDDATFSQQVNSVTDTFDALAVRNNDPRLTDLRTPADASVTTAKLANGAVTGAKIAATTITEANLAPSSVGSPEIIDGTIQSVDLADAAITLGKLAAASVSTGALVDGAVTIGKLAAALAQAVAQPGFLQESLIAAAPPGWLVCDGSAVSRTQYAALFAAIGIVWGSGDGSTTFSLPDLRGRCMVGAGQGAGLTARALGSLGGAESYRLTTTDLPAHTHNYSGTSGVDSPDHAHSGTTAGDYPDHAHSTAINNLSTGSHALAFGSQWTSPGVGYATWESGGASARHQHDFGTGGANARHAHAYSGATDGGGVGGGAHPIVQPFAAVTILIKT